jgi:hypothetical protein
MCPLNHESPAVDLIYDKTGLCEPLEQACGGPLVRNFSGIVAKWVARSCSAQL